MNIEVEIIVEVLGKKLTRAEAEALYYKLQQELNIQPSIVTYPVYPSYPTYTPGTAPTYQPYMTCNDLTPTNNNH